MVRPQLRGQGRHGPGAYSVPHSCSGTRGKVGQGLLTCTDESGPSPGKTILYFSVPVSLEWNLFEGRSLSLYVLSPAPPPRGRQ